MKNLKKILIVCICLILLGCLAELVTYMQQSARLLKQGYSFTDNIPPYPTHVKTFSKYYFSDFDRNEMLNNKTGNQYKNKPVIVFGDVFVNSISSDKNLTHLISDTLKAPVYNFATAGWGIQHMYFLLNNENDIKGINPETIIYVYNQEQMNKLTSFSFYPHNNYLNLKYKKKGCELKEQKPFIPFLYNSYTYRNIERCLGWKKTSSPDLKVQQEKFDLMQKLFEESRNVAKAQYPSLKNFVIIRISVNDDALGNLKNAADYTPRDKAEYEMWQNLIKEGFTVVDITNFVTKDEINQNRLPDSSLKYEFMQKFVPALLEKANLKT